MWWDVGVVEHRKMVDGKSEYKQYEVDFIATDGNEKYYIQSAYEIETGEKREQKLNSLKRIDDSFPKIVYRQRRHLCLTGTIMESCSPDCSSSSSATNFV